jgi:capsid protein
MTGRPFDYEQYADVSARDLMLSFIPQFVGQVRGFSTLGASLFDWQDIAETRQFELLAQKIGASIALLEKNETGEPPPGADFIIGPPAGTEAAGTATGVQQEILDGGVIRYLRARSGSNLEAFQQDRPTGNQIAFEANVIRSSFHGMDWSVDFSLDPTKVGGASMRVVIERINRAVAADQDLVLAPPTRRYDGYALAKAMKLGLLPWDDDWWRFEYQGPARLTADAKYDSDVQLQEVRAGVRSRARMAANLGEDLTDVRQIREREVNELLTAARRIADQHGIPLGTALALLESDNSLPVQSAPSPEAEPPARNEPAPARE